MASLTDIIKITTLIMSPCQGIREDGIQSSADANILVRHDSGIWFGLLPTTSFKGKLKHFYFILSKTKLY